MDIETEFALFNSIQILEAQENLDKMRVAMWPEMKPKSRESDHKKLYDVAYPRSIYPRESISLADFIKKGGSVG